MSNKKFQKVVVYLMIAAMVASSVLIGLSVFL
ncbi:stressosome-associated protein Prli42 [Sporosarcina luteola]|nr:stressosome-associated protein Prli42 [Sporosarcina luteola]MCM3743291.1 stressosome-associated protein Prli42 [Sporosarcina luteola]